MFSASKACALLLFAVAPLTVPAATIASNTAGTGTAGAVYIYGQSFTTVSGGPWNDISFSFETSSMTPYALGTGYLFSTEYLGTPNGLSSSDPGYLGSVVSSGGAYTFAPSLTLNGNTQYFFYEDDQIPDGNVNGGNVYSGGQFYYSVNPSSSGFTPAGVSADFTVNGTAVSTTPPIPEPSSLLLLGTGIMGLALMGQRRLRAKAVVARR